MSLGAWIFGLIVLVVLAVPLWLVVLRKTASVPPPPMPIPNLHGIARVYRIQESIVPGHLEGFLRNPLPDSPLAGEWDQFRMQHLDPRDWIPGIFVRERSPAWKSAIETPGLAVMSSSGQFVPSAKGIL